MTTPTLSFEVDENMLFWAFRYALGRRTGAVDSVVKHLKMHWDNLSPQTREQISEEISTAITRDEAGAECDIESWRWFL